MKKKHLLRTVRNLFFAVFLAALMWIASDYPLPMEMDFRRAERQNLVDPSEIVWTYYGTYSGDLDVLVGLAPNTVHTYARGYRFYVFPRREESSTLVSLPEETRYSDGSNSYLAPSFLVPDPPAQAATARLTVTLDANDWREDYVVEAPLTDGIFFFQLKWKYRCLPEYSTDEEQELFSNESAAFSVYYFDSPQEFTKLPYTLEFFDPNGALLETVRQEGWLADVESAS